MTQLDIAAVSAAPSDSPLRRSLGFWDVLFLGLGGVVGTGVFVVTGRAAAFNAGPAVTVSFVLGGIAAAFAAMCYAELASMSRRGGSAYAYAHATLGEYVAFLVGWNLILEYGLAAATVSVGWSGYARVFLERLLGVTLPPEWTTNPVAWDGQFCWTGAYVNLPAVLIVLGITLLLARGTRLSSRFNTAIVCLKLATILIFVGALAAYVQPAHWHPFVPDNLGTFGRFGWSGVFQGATTVFFAYCGFDAVSTAAQEAKNPQRDIPLSIIACLLIATVLYVIVGAVLTGVVPYQQLSVAHPLAVGVQVTGMRWLETLVEGGAVIGLASTMLMQLFGQSRIFFAMGEDGLLPAITTQVHRRFGTPYAVTWLTGAGVALLGGLLPIEVLGELTSIGTLSAFAVVCVGVVVLRYRRPELPRSFRYPGGNWAIPALGVACSLILMLSATFSTLARLLLWMGVGSLVYLGARRRRAAAGVYGKNTPPGV